MANLVGHHLRLRLVELEDAEYIHSLRLDPQYGRFLSAPAPTVESQQSWIERYKAREAERREYYFLIERRQDDLPCGVVRLYEIKDGQFTWGSWILDKNKPPKAALDSALLIYRFAFEVLACELSIFDVRVENSRTLAFHRRFGAVETGVDELNVYFELSREQFALRVDQLNAAFRADD